MREDRTAEIVRLASLISDLASAEDEDQSQGMLELPLAAEGTDRKKLVKIARREIASRNIRSKFLPADMFAEGGWNILLDLFVAEESKANVSITDACIASGIPTTTALRHIAILLDRSLIYKACDRKDRRREFLFLTHVGRDAMRAVLEQMDAIASRSGESLINTH